MEAIETLLVVFDGALNDEWESLASAITDLTETEAAWQHPAYAAEPHDKGVGVPGTILWHLNHLELCHRHYIATIRNMDPSKSPDTQPPGELPLAQVLPALKKASAGLREAIASLKPEDLTGQVRPKRNAASFIAMIAAHICWHAGMIKQTRRLYAKR
ncbi:MAG: DinB family protein [Planctomycetota bacterium]|nr:DinB family protein [Planctomycetota bacterium]